jgi:adenylate cyclase
MNDVELGLDVNVVREELRRILAADDFDASDRNREFLRYVVEETLSGRADRIKAYNIATSVFGRNADFDPQADSIVRIEAGRLRRSLERYYLTAGRGDGIRIAIPRGGYAAVFEAHCRSEAPALPSIAPKENMQRRTGRTVLVRPFEEAGDHSSFPNFTRGLTRQVIVGLTRFVGLKVYGAETTYDRADARPNPAHPAEPLDVDFLLVGGTTLSAERFTLEVLLSDARSGRFIWGETFERTLTPGEIVRVRDKVANSIVRSLAEPYGVIFGERARELEGKPPEQLSSYESVAHFYRYWRTYDRELIRSVRDGLEHATRRDPDYAEAFACLSLVYIDWLRFGYAKSSTGADVLLKARSAALRAVELAPLCSRAHHALALAFWFAGDVPGAFAELQTGLSLNPNDTEIMADLGLRHAVLMEWDQALALLRESFARNPAQPGSYRIGLALYHYMHGRYREALAEMRRMPVDHVVQALVVLACAAARVGVTAEADAAIQSILRIDPAYGDRVVEDLKARNLHPDIIAAMVDGLRLARLPGRDTGVPDAGVGTARIVPCVPAVFAEKLAQPDLGMSQ